MSSQPTLTPLVVAAQDRIPCVEHGYLADCEAAEDANEFKSSERAMNVDEESLVVVPLCATPQVEQQPPAKHTHQALSSLSEETFYSDGSMLDLVHRSDQVPFPHCTSGCNTNKHSDYTQLRRRLNWATALIFLVSAGVIIGVSCYFTPGNFRWAVVMLAAQLPLLYILQYSLGILVLPLVKPEILHQNSQFYSANAPDYTCSTRPSVTLLLSVNQNPLTKEGAAKLQDAQEAVAQHELHGGKANLMVIDADLLALDEPEKAARISLYHSLGLTYIGLPTRVTHGSRTNGSSNTAGQALDSSLQLRRSRNYVLNIVRRMETRIEQANSLGASLPALDAMHQVWSSKKYDREFLAEGDVAIGDVLITLDMDSNFSSEGITSMVNEFAHSDDISFVRSVSSSSSTASSTSPSATGRRASCGEQVASHVMKMAEMVKVVMGAIGGIILPADDDFAVKWATLRELGNAFELADSVDHVEFWDEINVTGSLDLACTLSKRGMLGRYIAYNEMSPQSSPSSFITALTVFFQELPMKSVKLLQHCWRMGRWSQWHHIIVLTMSPWAVLLAVISALVSLFLAFDMPALWTVCAMCAALLVVAVSMVVAGILLSHMVCYHCQHQARSQKPSSVDIEHN